MRVGFTGTQVGMTQSQKLHVWRALCTHLVDNELWVAHGDCIGADHDFHRMARQLGCKVHLFPPIKKDKRAFCDHDLIEPPDEYLARDHAIVESVEAMLATPGQENEILRSGTWATIRYSRKTDTPLTVISPSGLVTTS